MQKSTREEAIAKAGQVAVQMEAAAAQMTPRELAEASWTPTAAASVDELEDEIRADRGLSPLEREEVVED